MTDWSQPVLAALSSQAGLPLVGATVLGGAAAGLSNAMQQRAANVFPVLYSGVARLQDVNTAAQFYAAANDMIMATTEAWNIGRASKRPQAMLDAMQSPPLHRYCQDVMTHGRALLQELREHTELSRALRTAVVKLDNTWTYRSKHNHRTETYQERYTDAKGHNRSRTRTRRVYIDTDHHFEFRREAAEESRVQIEAILRFQTASMYQPQLRQFQVEPAILGLKSGGPYRSNRQDLAQGVRSERAYIQQTILERSNGEVSETDLRRWLNAWLRHATLPGAITRTHRSVEALRRSSAHAIQVMRASDRTYHFKTQSRSHTGPAGYRAVEKMRRDAQSAFMRIQSALHQISRTVTHAEKMSDLSRGHVPGGWPNEPLDIAQKALDIAVESYLGLFPQSPIKMDQRVRGAQTALAGMVGALLGALAGFILHPANGLLSF